MTDRPGGGSRPSPPAWRAVFTLGYRTVRDALSDRILGLSAEVAFFFLLSIPPLVLAVLGTLGFFAEVLGEVTMGEIERRVLDTARAFLTPQTVEEVIAPTVHTVLEEGRADVASIGLVVTLWSGSRAMNALLTTIRIAYDLKGGQRGWRRRLMAFGLTAAGLVVGIVVLPLLVLGPALDDLLGYTNVFLQVWEVAYWPVLGLVCTGLLATLYHIGTPWHTPWRRDLPGAVLAMAIWLLGSVGLRVYVARTIEADGTYGPLAAPLVVLMWFYVTALAVLMGAELNAEIEKMWPTIEPEEKRGEPGVVTPEAVDYPRPPPT